MTEAEWPACKELDEMLIWLREAHRATPRQLRLFAVACCHRIWHLLTDRRSRGAVETAERWADGLASDEELIRAGSASEGAIDDSDDSPTNPCASRAAVAAAAVLDLYDVPATHAAHHAALHAALAVTRRVPHRGGYLMGERSPVESAAQVGVLRDIFGNPFRPVTADPSWLTPTVTALARQMYESRDFGAMPILADALQDVGCDNDDVLNHCRGLGQHVRGCWVVDLVLNKE